MKKYSELVNRGFKNNKKRNTYIIIGITLGIILLTSILYLNSFLNDINIERSKESKGDWYGAIQKVNEEEKRGIEGNIRIKDYGYYTDIFNEEWDFHSVKREVSIVALDKISLNKIFSDAFELISGNLPTKEEEIIIDENGSFTLNKTLGEAIELGGIKYKIVGVYKNSMDFTGKNLEFISFLSEGKEYKDLNVAFNTYEDRNIKNVIKSIASDIGRSDNITINEYYIHNIEQGSLSSMSGGKLGGIAIYCGIFLLTLALIYAAINTSIREKIGTFTILKSLGASRDKIRWLLIKEGLMFVGYSLLSGIILGTLLGILVTKFVIGGIIGLDLKGVGISLYPKNILLVVIMITISIILSTIIPVLKYDKISLIQGIKDNRNIRFNKKVKGKWIRKYLGYKWELAYKNLTGNNKSFKITLILYSTLMIFFIGFTGNLLATRVANKERIKNRYRDFTVSFSSNSMGEEVSGLENYKSSEVQINKYIEKLKSEGEFDDFSQIIEVNIAPIFKNVKPSKYYKNYLLEEVYDETFLSSTNNKLYVYDDEEFNFIKPFIKGENLTLDGFKENGIILVNNRVQTGLFSKEMVSLLNLNVLEKIKVDFQGFSGEKRNYNNENELEMKVMGTVDINNIPEGISDIFVKKPYFIVSKDFFLRNIDKIIREGYGYNTRVYYNVKNKDNAIILSDEMQKLSNEFDGFFVNNYEEYKMMERQIYGMSIVVYLVLFITICIGIINIINSKNINFTYRKKEFGTFFALGIKDSDVKRILIYEGVIEWGIASFFGGVLGSLTLSIIYKLYNFFGDIYDERVPYYLVFATIIIVFVVILLTSTGPLRKYKNISTLEMIKYEE